ncbi:MAG: hypothetical protein H8D92_02385 [Pelagibacteraceae bacterium]|nr:hypothetical protein [Pelagibacteraceae bacterium]
MTQQSKIGRIGRLVVKAVKVSTSLNEAIMNHYIKAIQTTTKSHATKTKKNKKTSTKREMESMPIMANTFYVLHSKGMNRHKSVLLTGIEQSVFYTKTNTVRKQFEEFLTQEDNNQTSYGKNLFVFANKIEELIPILEKKTSFTFGGHYNMSKNSKGKTTFSFFTILMYHHVNNDQQTKDNTKSESIEANTKSSIAKSILSCCDEVI